MSFLYGFLAAWFIFALLFFLSEEKGVPFTILCSHDWVYYLIAAPVLVPIMIVLLPPAMMIRGYRKIHAAIKDAKMHKRITMAKKNNE